MPADLERDPVILLHLVGRLLRVLIDKRARDYGMTRAQWIVLVWVAREPGMTQQAMADILEVEPISVGRLVDKLESHGFIERRRDPKDRRVWRLHNLPAAVPIVDAVNDIRRELRDSVRAAIGPERSDSLVDALLLIKARLQEERDASEAPARKPSTP